MTEKTKQEIIKAQETVFVRQLKRYAHTKGYELGYVWVKVYDNGFESLQFLIIKKDYDSYTPTIYENTSINFFDSFDNNPKFEVQTTSYGALNEKEMQKFMYAMNKGWEMQQHLNIIDWSECPRIKVEEE